MTTHIQTYPTFKLKPSMIGHGCPTGFAHFPGCKEKELATTLCYCETIQEIYPCFYNKRLYQVSMATDTSS